MYLPHLAKDYPAVSSSLHHAKCFKKYQSPCLEARYLRVVVVVFLEALVLLWREFIGRRGGYAAGYLARLLCRLTPAHKISID